MIYRDLIGDLIDIFARIIRQEKKVFTGTIIELDWKLIPEIFGTFNLLCEMGCVTPKSECGGAPLGRVEISLF